MSNSITVPPYSPTKKDLNIVPNFTLGHVKVEGGLGGFLASLLESSPRIMPLWGDMKRLTQGPIVLLHLYPVSMMKALLIL